MHTAHTTKLLTLGEFIIGVYDTCGEHRAGVIVWLTFNTQLVVFRRHENWTPPSQNLQTNSGLT